MGHLYKGGMWFKKKSGLQAESHYNTEKSVDGTDWRTRNTSQSWSPSMTLPSAADAGNYFFLPALGSYDSGQLNYVGSDGYYWSSSAYPFPRDNAYYLGFNSSNVYVSSYKRYYGFRVGVFE